MTIIGWIVLGLVAGAIAKMILPGKQGGGWLATLLLGIVGAVVGGALGALLVGKPLDDFWNPWTWVLAIGGSLLVLLIWGFISNRGKRA